MVKRKRNYRDEYDSYHKTDEQKKRRAQRNAARRKALKNGTVSKGDNKEIDHSGSNRKGLLGKKTRIVAKKTNRRRQPKRDGSQD